MKPLIYSFRFGHHGRFSSYHRLTDYLPKDFKKVTAFTNRWLIGDSPRLLRIWLRANEYRLAPFLLTGKGKCVHYLYPENSLYSGLHWGKHNKIIVTWHQPLSYLTSLPEPYLTHARSILQKAAAVIFLSEESMNDHVDAFNLSHCYHIKHGVDTTFFTFSENAPRKAFVDVITVGNWLRDHRCWAETVRTLLARNASIRFSVLCNKHNRELYQHCLSIGDSRVQFLDSLDDLSLRDIYRRADIAFIPLLSATANNSLLECMASGVPCVISDLCATREYAGNSAVFINNLDIVGAADAIERLATSQNRRTEIAKLARRTAERELSWPIVAQRHCELYASIA